jgi:hypothetical protein
MLDSLRKKPISRNPPSGASEGTVWYGGPVDRFRITLRILGEQLDPDQLSTLLGCPPTKAERAGVPISAEGGSRIPQRGRWSLTIESKNLRESDDVEDGIKMLLERLPSDPELWASLTRLYQADVFCGLFLETSNRGFGLSAEVSRLLADRYLDIGFDVYFDPPEQLPESS